MIKRILLSIVLLLITAYLVMAITAFNRKPEGQVCHDIQLIIQDTAYAGFITQKEVISMLEKKGISPIGKKLDRIRTKTVEKELSKHPLIDRAECYKTPSGKLCVEVTQRIPVLRVMSDNGENYYLDNKGTVMPPHAKCVAHLAVATGSIEKSFAMRDLYKFDSRTAGQKRRTGAAGRRPPHLPRPAGQIREQAETGQGFLREGTEPGRLEQILPDKR